MDLYTPTRIEEVFRRSPRVTTFLKSTFFKGSKTFVTKSVNFDIVEGSRSVAPFVNPKAGGQVIPNKGYSTKTYTAPLVSPEKVTEAEEMLNRIAGEQITSSMTPAERAVRKLSEDLVEMDEMITRREEVMCAEALFTGKITVKGKNIDDEIDFGFSNTETLSKKWSAAGSDPIADLQKWKRAISKEGYVNANICIMSVDAANAFIGNANVQKLLDIRNYEITTIKPRELSNGVSFIGNIPMMGLSIYTYDEWYLDDWTDPDSPVTKPFVPDGTVGLFSTAARFDMLYGAISNFNGKTQAPQTFTGKRYSESFLSSDNRVRTVRISSRPLAVPHNLKSWYIAKVL